MKIRKPDYYDRFRCIAGACKDSCCIGWEIDVDEERQDFYRNIGGELGARLRTCIDWEEGHFILQGKEERCPFLNEENLCDLILGLGEESLCDICREHPRYYEWYDDLTEVGVGICCEAAAGLVLESEEPATFVLVDDEETVVVEEDDDTVEVLMKARDTAWLILQDRTVSIWERINRFLTYVEELQDGLDFENLDEIEESAEFYRTYDWAEEKSDGLEPTGEENRFEVYDEMIKLCKEELETMDESWPETLDEIERLLNNEAYFMEMEAAMGEKTADRDYEYEHLAVYFVYRYFMKCRIDGDVYSKGMLVKFCLYLIYLLDVLTFSKCRYLTKEDRAQNAKTCSKEIEYSEENLTVLADIFWEDVYKL